MGVERAGFDCLAQVEWDEHCQNVLARHWPDVPRWGDIQTVSGYEIPPADLVIFGSPCQDLSVAGKRQGLDGERSSMFYEAMRVIKEMRDGSVGTLPRVVVWENVAGALFSNGGADFGKVLDEMADLGALVIEWAVLDARYFGVPQRRRRIFLVAIFDPALADRCPEQLLPVAKGRRRNPSSGSQPREGSSSGIGGSPGEGSERILIEGRVFSGVRIHTEVSPALQSKMGTGGNNVPLTLEEVGPIGFDSQASGGYKIHADEQSPPVRIGSGIGIASPPAVLQPIDEEEAIAIQGTIIGRSDTAGPQGRGVSEPGEPMYTLDTVSQHAVLQPIPIQDGREIEKRQNGLGIAEPGSPAYTLDTTGAQALFQPVVFEPGALGRLTGPRSSSEVAPTLRADMGDNRPAVVQPVEEPVMFAENQRNELRESETSLAVTTGGGKPGRGYPAVRHGSVLRKLLPIECERLMGWPDDHTRYRADGTEVSDSTRYKMCGNGVASPVAEWVARQIRPLFDL